MSNITPSGFASPGAPVDQIPVVNPTDPATRAAVANRNAAAIVAAQTRIAAIEGQGYVASAVLSGLGPSAMATFTASKSTILSVNVPVVAGRHYQIDAYALGSVIAAGLIQFGIADDQNGFTYFWYDTTGSPTNTFPMGNGAHIYAPTATKTALLRLAMAGATTGTLAISEGGAWLLVEDIG